jgi:hypothetical protein
MSETNWTYLVPEICKHGVDQRYKWSFKSGPDGCATTIVTRDWCRQCLSEIDTKAILEFLRTQDINHV